MGMKGESEREKEYTVNRYRNELESGTVFLL